MPISWRSRLLRLLTPPDPFIHNPREMIDAPLGRWNLIVGGAGQSVRGYVNIDLIPGRGVDVLADAHHLPFSNAQFQRVECDAVLEHVRQPNGVMQEIQRVLVPGGVAHIVAPFCHPYHEHPRDFHRFTPDALREMTGGMEILAEGWRTGPTATMLVFVLEYVKLWLPWRLWRIVSHGLVGWTTFPLRYLDLLFFRRPNSIRLGNHYFIWLRKAEPPG